LLRPTLVVRTPHSNRIRPDLQQRPEFSDLELTVLEALHAAWSVRLYRVDGRVADANFPGESDDTFGVPILGQREGDTYPSAIKIISLRHLTLRPELLA
jgi:hypothetical protein